MNKHRLRLSDDTVATLYRVSRNTVRRWRAAGLDVLSPRAVLSFSQGQHRTPPAFEEIFDEELWCVTIRCRILIAAGES